MSDTERRFPPLLAALHELAFDYADGEGIDFEPYSEFMSASDTTEWLRAWTGNHDVDANEYKVFGQDGTGGYAAFWLARPGRPLLEQPVVFFGSEGSLGVVARNFDDYLWLLAGGLGPFEAVEYPQAARKPVAHFADFCEIARPRREEDGSRGRRQCSGGVSQLRRPCPETLQVGVSDRSRAR